MGQWLRLAYPPMIIGQTIGTAMRNAGLPYLLAMIVGSGIAGALLIQSLSRTVHNGHF